MPRKRTWKQIKKCDIDLNSDPYDRLVIAIYKQAVNDLIADKYVSQQDRESAKLFLQSTKIGLKCLQQLEKEGLYNGDK